MGHRQRQCYNIPVKRAGDAQPVRQADPEALPIAVGAQFIQKFFAAFPDSVHSLKDSITEGDRVAVRFILHGTHKGEFNGIAPTGNPIESEGMHIYHFAEEISAEMWIVEDKLGLMQQLGMELRPVKGNE